MQFELVDLSEPPETRVLGKFRYLVDAMTSAEVIRRRNGHPITIVDRKTKSRHDAFRGIWIHRDAPPVSPLNDRAPRGDGKRKTGIVTMPSSDKLQSASIEKESRDPD